MSTTEFKSGPANMATRQAEYARALRAPYSSINAEIRRAVIKRDIFGYHDTRSSTSQLADFDPDDLTPGSFRFDDNAQNHREFMMWLRRQQRMGVLSVISSGDNTYVERAAEDGTKWANARLREAGLGVGPDDLPVGTTFNQALDANQLRLLYERNFDLLEGITTDTSSSISRVLNEGLVQGENPTEIARSLSHEIGLARNRATIMARNEIMLSHNRAAKSRMEAMDVDTVKWLGTNPCPECSPYVGGTYPINDIPEGGPPLHPACVGCISPVI